jgi:hypothetical protein
MEVKDIQALVEGFLAKHQNNATAAVAELYRDNYDLREKNRTLKSEKEAAEKKIPAEGSVVLSADEAKVFEAYSQLGTPDQLKKSIEEAKTSKDELGKLKRSQILRDVADIEGMNPSVLSRLASDMELEIEEYSEIENGESKAKKRALAVVDGRKEPLKTFATREWVDFLPSLNNSAANAGNNGKQAGVTYPQQGTGGTGSQGGTGDLVQKFLEDANKSRESLPNPLELSK